MSAALSRLVTQPRQLATLWRIPANGQGNGLDGPVRAPVADISDPLIEPPPATAFRAASVPPYAAPAARCRRPRGTAANRDHRICGG